MATYSSTSFTRNQNTLFMKKKISIALAIITALMGFFVGFRLIYDTAMDEAKITPEYVTSQLALVVAIFASATFLYSTKNDKAW